MKSGARSSHLWFTLLLNECDFFGYFTTLISSCPCRDDYFPMLVHKSFSSRLVAPKPLVGGAKARGKGVMDLRSTGAKV
jgi:hypothetical protein